MEIMASSRRSGVGCGLEAEEVLPCGVLGGGVAGRSEGGRGGGLGEGSMYTADHPAHVYFEVA